MITIKILFSIVHSKAMPFQTTKFFLIAFQRTMFMFPAGGPLNPFIMSIVCIFPDLQTGHLHTAMPRANSNASCHERPSNFDFCIGCAKALPHCNSNVLRCRTAKIPKYLILQNPLGRTCNKNRRINSGGKVLNRYLIKEALRC